jgi:hypothetical protein
MLNDPIPPKAFRRGDAAGPDFSARVHVVRVVPMTAPVTQAARHPRLTLTLH